MGYQIDNEDENEEKGESTLELVFSCERLQSTKEAEEVDFLGGIRDILTHTSPTPMSQTLAAARAAAFAWKKLACVVLSMAFSMEIIARTSERRLLHHWPRH